MFIAAGALYLFKLHPSRVPSDAAEEVCKPSCFIRSLYDLLITTLKVRKETAMQTEFVSYNK
jgi:hypothetical protein